MLRQLRKIDPKYYLFAASYFSILFVGIIWVHSTTNLKHLKAEFHKKHPVILSSDGKTLITTENYDSILATERNDSPGGPVAEPLVLEEEPPTIDEIHALLEQHAVEQRTVRAETEALYAKCLKLDDEYRQLKEEEKALTEALRRSEEALTEQSYSQFSGDVLTHSKLLDEGRYDEARELVSDPNFGVPK